MASCEREAEGAQQIQTRAERVVAQGEMRCGKPSGEEMVKQALEGLYSQTGIKPLQDTCSHRGKSEDLAHGGGHRR